MSNLLENYPGAKNGNGVYQKIISAMPEHKIFIELFFGSGAITRRKRPAALNFGVEINYSVIQEIKDQNLFRERLPKLDLKLFHGDVLEWLQDGFFRSSDYWRFSANDVLIYADPPYLQETRSSQRDYYENEFKTPDQHSALISALRSMKCRVMLSGYRSDLYNRLLHDWRTIDIPTSTRGGPAIETVWLNFAEPLRLHDYRYLGENFTDRQRIKRKRARWLKKLQTMPSLERQLLFDAIRELENTYD